MRARALSAALGAALLASAAGPSRLDAQVPEGPPRPAPRLELPASDGSRVRLADLLGRVVVVDFWASWCAPCRQSFPALDALYRELHQRGLEVLAVSVDEKREDAEAFLASRTHRMTVLFDPAALAAGAFDVEAMPTTVVVDRRGLVRSRHEGYSPSVARAVRASVERLLAQPGP